MCLILMGQPSEDGIENAEEDNIVAKVILQHAWGLGVGTAWTSDMWALERTQTMYSWRAGREVGWWNAGGGSRRYALSSTWMFSVK